MLEKFKELFAPSDLLKGNFGIERETIRVNEEGELSTKPHARVFGSKIKNPYITTDFSESQIEMITPPFNRVEDTYDFLNSLYDIVALEIGDEYLWPQSMPAIVPEDSKIPVADYGEEGKEQKEYRKMLLKKYGGRKQLISGIHYNFSYDEYIIKTLYKCSASEKSYKEFRNDLYLKVARNYLRYRWLIIYLLGATSAVHNSYFNQCKDCINECGIDSKDGVLSYRNGKCGYKNKVDLYPNYSSIKEYTDSIRCFIKEGLIDSHKELYSQIRLKSSKPNDFLNSLEEDGISYLEYRSFDVNPFEKCGISLNDLHFLQIINIYLLIKEEDNNELWQEEAQENQYRISKDGRKDITLINNSEEISKRAWALDILDEMDNMCKELNLHKEYIIDLMKERVLDHNKTYAHRLHEIVREEGYIESQIELAKHYKKEAYNNRFKLQGYEDLELSTQILMKESIKRGIKVDVIDRNDNFISLESINGKKEYIKQATKTSKDNYITVLMMENKVVTKKILKEHGVKVPDGEEFASLEEAKNNSSKFINMPIVIKPKSTNFGTGISVFKEGATEEEIVKAFEFAFKFDNTVLVEEFIKGKEYRFLVIGDEVVGILHRVPANVVGDGEKTIEELVSVKNTDPLRGKGYKTPLEKIKLDEGAKLFLNNQQKDFKYIPSLGEVVYLRENSNISTGGDSIDYTDEISERFKKIAVDATKAVGAKICGVDIMLEDIKDKNSNYGIIELNFNPAIHIHSFPYKGRERNIAVEVLKVLEMVGDEDDICAKNSN